MISGVLLGFYWVLLGFTGFYWAVLGLSVLGWVLLGVNRVLRTCFVRGVAIGASSFDISVDRSFERRLMISPLCASLARSRCFAKKKERKKISKKKNNETRTVPFFLNTRDCVYLVLPSFTIVKQGPSASSIRSSLYRV